MLHICSKMLNFCSHGVAERRFFANCCINNWLKPFHPYYHNVPFEETTYYPPSICRDGAVQRRRQLRQIIPFFQQPYQQHLSGQLRIHLGLQRLRAEQIRRLDRKDILQFAGFHVACKQLGADTIRGQDRRNMGRDYRRHPTVRPEYGTIQECQAVVPAHNRFHLRELHHRGQQRESVVHYKPVGRDLPESRDTRTDILPENQQQHLQQQNQHAFRGQFREHLDRFARQWNKRDEHRKPYDYQPLLRPCRPGIHLEQQCVHLLADSRRHYPCRHHRRRNRRVRFLDAHIHTQLHPLRRQCVHHAQRQARTPVDRNRRRRLEMLRLQDKATVDRQVRPARVQLQPDKSTQHLRGPQPSTRKA